MIYLKICWERSKIGNTLPGRLACLSFSSINNAGSSAAENCRSCAGVLGFFLIEVSLWEGTEV